MTTRSSRASEPWWARAISRTSSPRCSASCPARSFSRSAMRSAARRLFTKTSVERCSRTSLQQLRVDGRPDAAPGRLAAGDGVELQGRVGLDHGLHGHVDAQVERLAHAGVDHRAVAAGADEKARHLVEGPLRRRQADPLHVAARLPGQPLQGHREVGAALGLRHRVDLVDDDPFRAGEQRSRLRREHQVERFRRGDQHVGRVAQHRRPLALRRVAGAHAHADVRADAAQRRPQIALDVVAERLERRDVDEPELALAGVRRRRLGDEAVERPQKGGKRLAGAGGRRDQSMGAGGDRRPCLDLRGRGLRERPREPLTDLGSERREGGMWDRCRHVHCGCPRARQASHGFGTEGHPRRRRRGRSLRRRRWRA